MTILRDKLLVEAQNIKESIPNQHALGYMEALKNIANDIDCNMLMEERKAMCRFAVKYLIHKDSHDPFTLFNRTFTTTNADPVPVD